MANPDQPSSLSNPDDLAAFIESHRRQLLAYAERIGKSDGAIRVVLTRTVAHLQEILASDSK